MRTSITLYSTASYVDVPVLVSLFMGVGKTPESRNSPEAPFLLLGSLTSAGSGYTTITEFLLSTVISSDNSIFSVTAF